MFSVQRQEIIFCAFVVDFIASAVHCAANGKALISRHPVCLAVGMFGCCKAAGITLKSTVIPAGQAGFIENQNDLNG